MSPLKTRLAAIKLGLYRRFFAPRSGGNTGPMALRNRFEDLRTFISSDSPVIVDGGAHGGGMVDIFLRQYPDPAILAIEPIPRLANTLKVKYANETRVTVHQLALGAESKPVSFNILDSPGSSSILTPTDELRYYHPGVMNIDQTITVSQIRLDNLISGEVDILKLDLQGYELEALKGCGDLLTRIKTITLEVEFLMLYEGQPLFAEIDLFLRKHDFRLFNLYELWTQSDGQLTAGDAVYLNQKYFPRNEI